MAVIVALLMVIVLVAVRNKYTKDTCGSTSILPLLYSIFY